jgi:Tfp pilus assembly protein PilZ
MRKLVTGRRPHSVFFVLPQKTYDFSSTATPSAIISTSGIFFETKSTYVIGATIRFFLDFKHETFQCEARVVRVEPRMVNSAPILLFNCTGASL